MPKRYPRTIRICDVTQRLLTEVRGLLMAKERRNVTVDETLQYALLLAKKSLLGEIDLNI